MSEVNTPVDTTPASTPTKSEALKAKLDGALSAVFDTPKSAKEEKGETFTPTIEAKVDAIEDAGHEAPEQESNESDTDYEARLNETLEKYKSLETEHLKTKKREGTHAKRVKELEAKFADAEKDVQVALALAGYDSDKFIQDVIDGKIKPKQVAQVSPELKALQEEMAQLKQEKADREREVSRTKHLGVVTKSLEDFADVLPLASSLPWVAEKALDAVYAEFEETGVEPDLGAVLRKYNEAVNTDAVALLSNERAVKALLKNDTIKAIVTRALGLDEQQPASPASSTMGKRENVEGPRSLSSKVTSIVPPRTEPLTDRERTAKAAEVVSQMFGRK